ncbi:DNA primase protein [Halorhabdus tiamatea SARL4B]|uniref:DNA primase DnaG n=1 Tax=Halorhabdus tiamatea SARL4B TaxID=1033806 RepID=F7PHW1_9EURY|nr:DNA primase DnaG [Halorhabdus tiamatea]ERJ06955.1 DNA primase protein [Halorhabdus tiamatea SARL4B]CCQ32344.1 DNA primase [Halorhabdus tiamatea SARL4B]
MHDSAKYLIHAQIEANGVVERSDVVGAIFGQTEGLLGDELDLRTLQESSKVGRIDVTIDSESGRSTGEVTIASGLDRVETAILAASLEAIDRVGPCRATLEVTQLEDVRTAKRREIVDRAEELLARFDEEVMSSHELVEEVRRRARVERITEYEGYPAGPRVADGDAIIVVEGRADVLTLLQYGIKNAVAVEGTNVPDAIADLTHDRTVTAFLDGDRGGNLILKELAQVGSVDYVAFAPAGRSVEDLSRTDVTDALREKVPYERVAEGEVSLAEIAPDVDAPGEAVAETDTDEAAPDSTATETGDTDKTDTSRSAPDGEDARVSESAESTDEDGVAADGEGAATTATGETITTESGEAVAVPTDGEPAVETPDSERETPSTEPADADEETISAAETLDDHVQAVIGESTEAVRLLDDSLVTLSEAPVAEAFETVRDADPVPGTVVIDGPATQRLLDVAAQRGVTRIVASERGDLVKQPTSVRLTVPGAA